MGPPMGLGIFLFVIAMDSATSSTEKSSVKANCLGNCISKTLACNDIQHETDCPHDTNCCIDSFQYEGLGYDSRTTLSSQMKESSAKSNGAFESSLTENDAILAPTADETGDDISTELSCPGTCVPKLYSQYCEYAIPNEDICDPEFLCCVTNEYVKSLQDNEELDMSSMKRSGSQANDESNCPGSCIESVYAEHCRESLDEFICPMGYTCCNIVDEEYVPESAYYGQETFKRLAEEYARDNLVVDDYGNVHSIDADGRYSMLKTYSPGSQPYDDYTPFTELVMLNGKVVIFTDTTGKLYQHFVPGDDGRGVLDENAMKEYERSQGYAQWSYEDHNIRRLGNEEATEPHFDEGGSHQGHFSQLQSPENVGALKMDGISEETYMGNLEEPNFGHEETSKLGVENFGDSIEKEKPDVSANTKLKEIARAFLQRKPSISTERPPCPGSCISSFLSFSCFGSSKVYDGFACPGRYVCCAKNKDIEKQEEYLKLVSRYLSLQMVSPNALKCGVKGGSDADNYSSKDSAPGEWCWQVAIISMQNQYICGGALIHDSFVVTSALCVTGSLQQEMYVRAGVTDLTDPDDNDVGQTRRVLSTFIHHDHDGTSLDNDLALLALEKPLNLNANVCNVCLPRKEAGVPARSLCRVTGYGFSSKGRESFVPGGDMSLKIHDAGVVTLEDEECIENVTKAMKSRLFLPSNSFCAAFLDDHDACQKDAGGPLVCKSGSHYELQGVVSWSFGCVLPNMPTVFVKIAHFADWIDQRLAVAALHEQAPHDR